MNFFVSVKTKELYETIKNICELRNDKRAEEVLDRILAVSDFFLLRTEYIANNKLQFSEFQMNFNGVL